MSLGRVLISKETHMLFFFFGEKSRQETFFVITFLHSACGNIAIFIKWYTIKD